MQKDFTLNLWDVCLNDGNTYEAIGDPGRGCAECALRYKEDLCISANIITDQLCSKQNIVWRKKEMLKSATQEMLEFDVSSLVDKQEEVQVPGTKYDKDKLQYSLIPSYALQEVARNLTIGLKKYKERDNWKKVPEAQQRYLDALYRHLEAHRRGELYDPDSSVPDMLHLAAVAVNAMFLMEFLLNPDLKD